MRYEPLMIQGGIVGVENFRLGVYPSGSVFLPVDLIACVIFSLMHCVSTEELVSTSKEGNEVSLI